jgi:predicted DNA binding protein
MMHDECWGEITDSYGTKIKTLFFEPYAKHALMLGIISVKGSAPEDISNFLNLFKDHKTIHKIIGTKRVANTCNITFFESFGDMTAGIMSNYPILWYANSIDNGIEDWRILLPKNMGDELRQDLRDVATIKIWSSSSFSKDILSFKFQLTDVEALTLKRAEKLGYFKSPRKIDLNELSRALGVSKQATSVTLRRALGKIVYNNVLE